MTPNTRQRKTRLSLAIFDTMEEKGITAMSTQDQVEILELLMKKMGPQNEFLRPTQPTKAGRKLTGFETRLKVWEYWHAMSDISTNTSRPAKLKVSEKPKIQADLSFISTVTQMENRCGINFFQSTWQTLSKTYKELYVDYVQSNPDNNVGYGTFLSLRPFYIRPAKKCDIEMCCCKKHLHARWSVKSLLAYAKLKNVELPFTNYATFFDYLNSDCESSNTTYISWVCASNNKNLCRHAEEKWDKLKNILEQSDQEKTDKSVRKLGKK